VLVALSGGADSTALALLLHQARDELDLQHLALAHMDHALRETSAAEAETVANWGRDLLGTGVVVERRPVVAEAGESPEEAARRTRYAFLVDAARAERATHVVTAHHADDQAETVLLRMLRGTGARGLRGIPEQRELTDGLTLTRPLLPFRCSALRAFLKGEGASFIEDPSNVDGNERARLRHVGLPALAECVARDPVPLLARLAANLADGLVASEPGSELAISRAFLDQEDGGVRVQPGFERLPAPLRAATLREVLPALRGDRPLTRAETQRLLAALSGQDESPVSGLDVEWNADGPRIVPSPHPSGPPESRQATLPGTTALWDDQRLELRVVDAGNRPFLDRLACADGTLELADADLVGAPLSVRTRRPGDRLRPLGAAAEARLGHILQRRHISALQRERIPLLCDEGGIVWAAGCALADRVRVSEDTRRILVLRLLTRSRTR